MRAKKEGGPGLGVVGDNCRQPVKSAPPSPRIWQGLEPLEPRILLSATTVGDVLTEPISASGDDVLVSEVGTEVAYQEQTQYDNFFKPNVVVFDFAVDPDAIGSRIDLAALSDLDSTSETVTYNIEGIVTGELWTGTEDGTRPFTATIDLDDADLATIAADGNLHIEFTPNSNVDDFGDVSEFITVGLSYEKSPTPISLTPIEPKIAGTYYGYGIGEVQNASDTGAYAVLLEAGQSIRVEGVPDLDLALSVEVYDPLGALIYSGASSTTGDAVISQSITTPSDGYYSIHVSSIDSLGLYRVNVFINEAIEDEIASGMSNDDAASAQSLDGYFRDIGIGLQKAVVRGADAIYSAKGHPAIAYELNESFESGVLPAGWTTYSTSHGRIQITDEEGASDGSYALLMDSTRSEFNLNEAIWTVDLTDGRPTFLSFDYAEWKDSEQTLPNTYTGSYNGDGVSISDDGVHWYRIFPAWDTGIFTRWESTTIDLLDAANDAGMTLGSDFKIKFQQYGFYDIPGDGRGYDNIALSVTGDVPIQSPYDDFYKFTLDAEQVASFYLQTDTNYALVSFKLFDPAGNVVDSGSGSYSKAEMLDIKAPVAGEYTLQITSAEDDYLLTILKGGTINGTNNGQTSDYRSLNLTGKAYGHGYADFFRITAQAGDFIEVLTGTPDDGVSGLNNHNPFLFLMGPNGGAAVAVDYDSAPDGRNAYLTYSVPESGDFLIGVYGSGVYTVSASGYSGLQDDVFEVVHSSYSQGQQTRSRYETITFEFDESLLPTSLDATDLMINGVPSTAARLIGPNETSGRIDFDVPIEAYVSGSNTLTIPASALRSLNGKLIEQTQIEFTIDPAPRIISSSIQQGDVLEPGQHILTLGFDEPIDESGLSTSSVYINGGPGQTGYLNVDWLTYDPATYELALGFDAPYEGRYTVTTSTSIKDLVGNLLDGEAPQGTLPPGVSGDGLPGGQFVLMFDVDRSAVETLSDFKPAAPIRTLGSSTGPIEGYINSADDTDQYRLDLQAGQMATVVLEPISQDSPLLTLEAMDEQLVAGGPGEAIVWTYRAVGSESVVDLVIGADMATQFELSVYLNAVRESDLLAASSSAEPVYDLAGAWVDIPDQPASVATVYGLWQSSVIRQTIEGSILAPGPYTFEFPDMFPPIGAGTLTITARADLDLSTEYLTIGGEGFGFGDVFASASSTFSRTATLTIPMADLMAMAADGTLTFDVTPSPGVNEVRSGGYLTLSIAYPGMRDPAQDAYALDLAAGQLFNAMLYSTDDAYSMELVDTQTGAVVAVGELGDLSNIQTIGYTAVQAGRYDIRVHTASGSDYTLAVIRDSELDVQPNSIDETNVSAKSLSNTDRVLGYVQSPRPDRLFALGRPSPVAIGQTVYELDPLTFEPIHDFSLENGIYAYDLAYDGINLYARSQQNGPIWTFDPESGALLHIIDYVNFSLFSDLASYGGLLVQQTGSIANQLTFYDSFDAGVIRLLDLDDVSHVQLDGLVGAEPRGSLFVTYREYVPETGYLTWVAEIDASSGQTLNSFTIDQANVTSLAFVADQLYAYSSHSGQLGIYDPSTGQPFSPPQSIGLYVAIVGDGVVPRSAPDRYTLDLQAGQRVTLSTATPFDTPGKTAANMLDPALRVLDPNGAEVANDSNGTADGKNAQLTFTATTAGVYTIQVLAETGYGEYVLNVERAPFLPGDLDRDDFVGIEDLNTVLGNWNQNVAVGDLAQGDASGDGFVGIEDLNAVLGNWNATLEPPTVEGDLDNDGFVGISDLNIVFGNWNQPVNSGDLTQGDPSNDGFVGIEDLNTVLGNWNAGTPPILEAIATSSREAVDSANVSSVIERPAAQHDRRSIRASYNDEAVSNRQHDTHSPAVAATWNYLNRRSVQVSNPAYMPWSLRQQEESPWVGLWEEDM